MNVITRLREHSGRYRTSQSYSFYAAMKGRISTGVWFINSKVYDNPDFHEYGMNSFAILTNNRLSKNTLVKYFNNIEEKVFNFLDNLDDSSLIETPESCGFTRLTLILAQYRHVMYHVGFITSILHYTEEKWPKYIGISAPIIQ